MKDLNLKPKEGGGLKLTASTIYGFQVTLTPDIGRSIWLDKEELNQIYSYIGKVLEEEPIIQDPTTILPQDLLKVYQNGCSDVRQILGNLFPEFEFEEEPKWPERYEEYGAFGWNGRTYVHKDFLPYMDKGGWSGYSPGENKNNPCPDTDYYNYGGASFRSFTNCLPPYIKIKNFNS